MSKDGMSLAASTHRLPLPTHSPTKRSRAAGVHGKSEGTRQRNAKGSCDPILRKGAKKSIRWPCTIFVGGPGGPAAASACPFDAPKKSTSVSARRPGSPTSLCIDAHLLIELPRLPPRMRKRDKRARKRHVDLKYNCNRDPVLFFRSRQAQLEYMSIKLITERPD